MPTFHVCSSLPGQFPRLSQAYPTPGDALEAACELWSQHTHVDVGVVEIADGAVRPVIDEAHIQTCAALSRMPGAVVN